MKAAERSFELEVPVVIAKLHTPKQDSTQPCGQTFRMGRRFSDQFRHSGERRRNRGAVYISSYLLACLPPLTMVSGNIFIGGLCVHFR